MTIGVISDTHGMLREQALSAFAAVDHILHAGDVGDPGILAVLSGIAPLTAIRGNIDKQGACSELPSTEFVELGGKLFYLVHSLHDLDIDPTAAGISVVVSGHSHKPQVEVRDGVTYLNPGSAGPRRFSLPVSVALVSLDQGSQRVAAKILELSV